MKRYSCTKSIDKTQWRSNKNTSKYLANWQFFLPLLFIHPILDCFQLVVLWWTQVQNTTQFEVVPSSFTTVVYTSWNIAESYVSCDDDVSAYINFNETLEGILETVKCLLSSISSLMARIIFRDIKCERKFGLNWTFMG